MRPPRPRTRSLAVAALLTAAACLYALPGLVAHWRFGSNYDLAIFDQVIWRLSRFEAPISTISGLNLFGDHFSPILVLIAPVYWIAPAAETLIVVQACLFAASIVPVFALLRRRVPDRQALALCAAYVLFWGLQRAAVFDFHEYAFAPLFIALALLAADTGRYRLLWLAAIGVALVKEDLLPFLVGVGVFTAIGGSRTSWSVPATPAGNRSLAATPADSLPATPAGRWRLAATPGFWHGCALIAFALLAFAVIVTLVVPAWNESGVYRYAGTYEEILDRPWLLPVTLVTPWEKARTLLLWLAPFGFLPLASPLVLLALPLALSRLLSASPLHWGNVFHYSAPLAPILAFAAADGLARVARHIGNEGRRAVTVRVALALAVLLSLILPGRQPVFRLFRAGEFTETPFLRSGRQALRMVPGEASVVAQTAIAPHLSRRPFIYKLDASAPDADIVIAAPSLSPWPVTDRKSLEGLIAARRERGYSAVFEENGWIVLRRR